MTAQSTPAQDLKFALLNAMHARHEVAASVSHRPDAVRDVFLDANARAALADAVLASPEMEAIRLALYQVIGYGGNPGCGCAVCSLPESVREWVAA